MENKFLKNTHYQGKAQNCTVWGLWYFENRKYIVKNYIGAYIWGLSSDYRFSSRDLRFMLTSPPIPLGCLRMVCLMSTFQVSFWSIFPGRRPRFISAPRWATHSLLSFCSLLFREPRCSQPTLFALVPIQWTPLSR